MMPMKCVVTVKFVGVLRGEIPTLAIVVVSRQELCDLRAGKQRTMNARWKEVEVVSCDFTHRTDYPFSGPVDCFVLSDETTMPFALGLVLVGVIGQPEFITCCSTQCIARYTPRVTAMVMEDSLLGFAYHFPTTIDWKICFIDCQDAIGHELGNTMTGGHHRGAILGEVNSQLVLAVLFTTKKKKPLGVPLWNGQFSNPSSLVPGCTRSCWAVCAKLAVVSKRRVVQCVKDSNGQPAVWDANFEQLKQMIIDDICSLIMW